MNPILVVGMNRGGTTMHGNVLCRHPEVAAPQHELHWGCKESQVLLHKQYWPQFSDPAAYADFLERYSLGDYFILARGDYDYFAGNPPASFYEFYLEMMDQFCAAEGAKYWVMKIEERFYHYPQELETFLSMLLDRYAQPRFIGILRDFEGVLKSHLRRQVSEDQLKSAGLSLGQQKFALSQTLRYASQRPRIRKMIREQNGLLLTFREATKEAERTNRAICEYLGLEFAPEMLEREYEANTSFKSSREREEIIAPWQFTLLDRVARPVFEALHPVGSAWRRMKDAREETACPVSYRLRDAGLLPETAHRRHQVAAKVPATSRPSA